MPQLPQLAPVLLAHPAMYPQLAAWLTQQQATTAQGTATTATPTAATGIAPTGTPALLDPDDDETVLTSAVLPGVAAAGVAAAGVAAAGAAAAGAAATGIGLAGTSAAGTASAAGAGSTGAAHTAAAAGAAKAGGLGLGAKLGIGAAAVTLAAGGGTAGYTAWHNAQTPATETTQTTPSHASLTEDALRQLLKTAPLTDNDIKVTSYRSHSNMDRVTTPRHFSDGLIDVTYQDMQAALTNDGRDEFTPIGDSNRATLTSQDPYRAPVVTDVNGDGVNDIVSLVNLAIYGDPGDGQCSSYTAVTAYTPTSDGQALEVLGQLMLTDGDGDTVGGLASDPDWPGYNSALDDALNTTTVTKLQGEQYTTTYWAKTLTVEDDQIKVGLDYQQSQWEPDYEPGVSATLAYPIVWQDGVLTLDTPTISDLQTR
ncbi:MAG: VCBS repeat-containing protein [Pseudoclavibacter caeni]